MKSCIGRKTRLTASLASLFLSNSLRIHIIVSSLAEGSGIPGGIIIKQKIVCFQNKLTSRCTNGIAVKIEDPLLQDEVFKCKLLHMRDMQLLHFCYIWLSTPARCVWAST